MSIALFEMVRKLEERVSALETRLAEYERRDVKPVEIPQRPKLTLKKA